VHAPAKAANVGTREDIANRAIAGQIGVEDLTRALLIQQGERLRQTRTPVGDDAIAQRIGKIEDAADGELMAPVERIRTDELRRMIEVGGVIDEILVADVQGPAAGASGVLKP